MIYSVELRDKITNELVYIDECETEVKLSNEEVMDFVHRVVTDYDLDTHGPDDYTVTLRVADHTPMV